MARFFISCKSIQNNTAVVTGPDVKHISRVLRLGTGEIIRLSTGDGREFAGRIREITSKQVVCEILAEREINTEAPVRVTLYQGLPKGDKMDLVIQKSTELGVARIVPVICERTVVMLDDKKAGARLVRWRRIAEEASKQSGRAVIPEVTGQMPFRVALEEVPGSKLALMPWEQESSLGIKQLLISHRREKPQEYEDIAVFIGPEGGFTKEEVDLARSRGVLPVSLGPRIMRAETAGLAAVTMVIYELGDLGGVSGD